MLTRRFAPGPARSRRQGPSHGVRCPADCDAGLPTADSSVAAPSMVVTAGSSGWNSHNSPEGEVRRNATGPRTDRPTDANAYGSVRQASRTISLSRSVGTSSMARDVATSSAWIQVSADRVVASDRRRGRRPPRGPGSRDPCRLVPSPARPARRPSGHALVERCTPLLSTISATRSSTDRAPAHPRTSLSPPAGHRLVRLAMAISSDWARWSTTSEMSHPSHRVTTLHSSSVTPASTEASSACCSASAVTTGSTNAEHRGAYSARMSTVPMSSFVANLRSLVGNESLRCRRWRRSAVTSPPPPL